MKGKFKAAVVLGMAAVMTLAVALAGCGSGDEPSPDPTPEPEEELTYADKSNLQYVDSLDAYKKTDWDAQWIWADKCTANSYVAFRKTFTLDSVPSSAIADIAAESKYYLWVNGELAVFDGGPKTGPTMYDQYYEQVDLTSYLKSGENLIVALVSYNGRSGNSSVDPGAAGFLFEMDLGSQKIVSDSSFKCLRLRAYKNQSLLGADWPNYPQFTALAEWDCYYDARDSVGDYTSASFDDSGWDDATVVCSKVGAEPFNDTYLSVTPLIKFDKTYTELSSSYIGQKLTQDTTIEIPMPYNMQFSPYFELTADSAGLRFTYYTDTFESQGESSFKDDYVTVAGSQTYESLPWRTGTTLIIEAPAGITFTKIGFRESSYNSEQGGTFVSDNEDLNTLWTKAYNTLKICMRDNYMDCPERERSPYIGDAANQIGETFYCLDLNGNELTKKTIRTIIGWVEGDSIIPLRTPASTLNECPAQTLAFLVAAYEYWLYTGDTETMTMFYPVALNYLKLWNMQASGLIEYRSGTFLWTDWGDNVDQEVIQNCWYYYALECMQALATDLGVSTDDNFYSERMTRIASAFDSAYWTENGYKSSTSSKIDDRANAMAVVCGLAGSDKYDTIDGLLTTTKYASPFMEKYVLEAMCLMGDYSGCLTRMQDRYGAMIEDDTCSTLWELWAKADGTENHGWSGGCLTVLSKYYGGIAPTSAGYASYDITLSSSFDSLSTSVTTVKGGISYTLSRSNGTYTISISTITADGTLLIPQSFGSTMTVNGTAQTASAENGFYAVSLSGGSYTVTVA